MPDRLLEGPNSASNQGNPEAHAGQPVARGLAAS